MATAVRNRRDTNGDGRVSPEEVASDLDRKLKANPGFDLPNGYDNSQGTVRRTPEPWLNRNPWVYPLAGASAGLIGSAVSGGSAASSGAGAGLSEAAIPTSQGIGAAGGLGAAAGGSGLTTLMRLLGAAGPVAGMFMNNGGGSLGSNASDVLGQVPQLKALLDLQLGQAQRADPLHQQLVAMSQRLLPNSSR